MGLTIGGSNGGSKNDQRYSRAGHYLRIHRRLVCGDAMTIPPIYSGRNDVAETREVQRQREREAQLARRRHVLAWCLALAGFALMLALLAKISMATLNTWATAIATGGF